LNIIDKLLKIEFKYLNIYFDGGTEFYDRCIINHIEEFFIKYKYDFISTTEDELKRLNRNIDIIHNNFFKLSNKLLIANNKDIKDNNKEILRDYQIKAITHITNELKLNNNPHFI
jgi:hypothetical protein